MHQRLISTLAVIASMYLTAAVPVRAQHPKMFVTSISGSPNLSTWQFSGGQNGISGARNVCQTLASNAGLAYPGSFEPFLSDQYDDAYCLVRGASGKKDSGGGTTCGLAFFLFESGPWLMPNGQPFANTTGSMFDDAEVFYPPRYDETGHRVPQSAILTGSDTDGVYTGSSCFGWSGTLGNGTLGTTEGTGSEWSSSRATANCGEIVDARLLCFQDSVNLGETANPSETGRTAFLSSQEGNGDLATWIVGMNLPTGSGVDAADEVCRFEAQQASLPHHQTFKAWLSTSTVDAKDRFVHDGPIVRPDGALVAANWADFLDGDLRTTINQPADGSYTRSNRVWTGTSVLGEFSGGNTSCDDWSSSVMNGFNGLIGLASSAGARWVFNATGLCDDLRKIYCISDRDVGYLFADGFESGGTTEWSASSSPPLQFLCGNRAATR